MPDLRTALQSAINEWNPEPEPAKPQPAFTVTTNVCRSTFEYVKANPGHTNREICDALTAKGLKRNSVSSLLAQMHHVGMLRRDPDTTRYFAVSAQYRPIKVSELRRGQKEAPIRAIKRKPKLKSASTANTITQTAAPPAAAASPVLPVVRAVRSIDELIDSLTIGQARELFNALKKLFV